MPPGHRHGVKAGVIVRGTGIQNVNVKSQMSLLKGRLNVGRLLTLLLVLVLAGFLNLACGSSANQTPPLQQEKPPSGPADVKKADSSRPGIGFASQQKLRDHYQKHGREFGSISRDEYLRRAQELRDKGAGGDVLETVRPDGVVSRFDQSTGSFIAFNRDGVIRTFFRPNDGAAYFWRQSRRKN